MIPGEYGMLIGKIILVLVIGAGLAAIVISLYKKIKGQPVVTPQWNKKMLQRKRIIAIWISLIFTTAIGCFIFIAAGINLETIVRYAL